MSNAIIVGSEGQDGRLLFDRLVGDDWNVIGIGRQSIRDSSGRESGRIDIRDQAAVFDLVSIASPDAVFYLPAVHQSSEGAQAQDDAALLRRSWEVHVSGLVHFLEAIANPGNGSLFYASSSLVFGDPDRTPQNEATPIRPGNIYAITKAAGMNLCRYYRTHRRVRASSGILFNHESPLRGQSFVSQKIARGVAAIRAGHQRQLVLGNLEAEVDWGYAPDYVDAMVRISALPVGDDYVIATGKAHTVQEFAAIAFAHAGLEWRDHVVEDGNLLTGKYHSRVGDARRLRDATGWKPSVTFADMVRRLVDAAAFQ